MKISERMDENKIGFAAKKFSMLTNRSRIKIIKLLEEKGELNVTQIHQTLKISQPEISINLILLKNYGILKKSRRGKNSFYSVNTEALEQIINISEDIFKNK